MIQRYFLLLTDGRTVNYEAPSAARAIFMALRGNLGRGVINCWTGGVADPKAPHFIGKTDFEVPAHQPMTSKPLRDKPPPQAALFPNEFPEKSK